MTHGAGLILTTPWDQLNWIFQADWPECGPLTHTLARLLLTPWMTQETFQLSWNSRQSWKRITFKLPDCPGAKETPRENSQHRMSELKAALGIGIHKLPSTWPLVRILNWIPCLENDLAKCEYAFSLPSSLESTPLKIYPHRNRQWRSLLDRQSGAMFSASRVHQTRLDCRSPRPPGHRPPPSWQVPPVRSVADLD